MRKKGFLLPMSQGERIFGWFYAFVHIFLMSYAIDLLYSALAENGVALSEKYINLIGYGIGFILIFTVMHHYMKSTFYDLCDNKLDSLHAVATGYLMYYGLAFVITYGIQLIADVTVNPNNDAVIAEFLQNKNIIMAVAAIMAPIVEEVLFRGVIFGTIRLKNRIAAYVISIVMFAMYHLWPYFVYDFSWDLIWSLFQYVPAGIALAWTFERARNIWAPIALHIIINVIALSVSLTFLG